MRLRSGWQLAVILLLVTATAWAQDSRISGKVTDSTGGVIPGVEVTVTNLETGVARQAVTGDAGRYSVPQLFAGKYRVSASMAGFDTQQLTLILDPQQTTGRGVFGDDLELGNGLRWKSFDFLLSKYFAMPWEGHRLQFRFEAFNLTNTPHLGGPGNSNPVQAINVNNTNGARIFLADLPRIIQFALKYNF